MLSRLSVDCREIHTNVSSTQCRKGQNKVRHCAKSLADGGSDRDGIHDENVIFPLRLCLQRKPDESQIYFSAARTIESPLLNIDLRQTSHILEYKLAGVRMLCL